MENNTISFQKKPIDRFTLIELITVMAIIILVMSMTIPAIGPMFRDASLKGKASSIRVLMMQARNMAVTFRSTYVITFTFDGPGDMNHDGHAGVAGFDDDQDGFIDEDLESKTFNTDAINADTIYTGPFGGSGIGNIYERGIPYSIMADEVDTDQIDNNSNGYTNERRCNKEIAMLNDDEDFMIDEGDSVYIENKARNDPLYHSNEWTGAREKAAYLSRLRASEEIYTGNTVIISRIWANITGTPQLLLVRKTLQTEAARANVGNEFYGTTIDQMGMCEDYDYNGGGKVEDYNFAAFYFKQDGRLYFQDNNNEKSAEMIVELRDLSSKNRRLVKVFKNGLMKIMK